MSKARSNRKGLPDFAFSPSLGRRVKPDDPDWPPKTRHWACRPIKPRRYVCPVTVADLWDSCPGCMEKMNKKNAASGATETTGATSNGRVTDEEIRTLS